MGSSGSSCRARARSASGRAVTETDQQATPARSSPPALEPRPIWLEGAGQVVPAAARTGRSAPPGARRRHSPQPGRAGPGSVSRSASRRRRRARLRTTALPILRVTVRPMPIVAVRSGSAAGPAARTPSRARRTPRAAARNSLRRRSRTTATLAAVRRGPLKPTGACAHGTGGRRAPCGHRRSPCGRESRAGVCVRACSADTCASQRDLRCRGAANREGPIRRSCHSVNSRALSPAREPACASGSGAGPIVPPRLPQRMRRP